MVDGAPERGDDDNTMAQERRRLIRRLAVIGPLVLGLLVILLLACVLWIPRWLYPPLTETDLHGVSDAAKVQELKGARLKLQNDARTTLLQGLAAVLVLTGAGIGATVTLRQIRISQGQLQATREQMQHTLETTQQQLNLTEQGQVTDRYTKAVEQLGHEKAPVRLGALYSLEHLAQDNPEYRQTVVDVVCAYLRMPYTLPAQTGLEGEQEEVVPPAKGRDRARHPAPGRDPAREELQVRQTAQRLLVDHLRCPPRTSGQQAQSLPPSSQHVFWPGISLDLTGATLIDFNFSKVSVIRTKFDRANFHGYTSFNDATIHGDGTFRGEARFSEATFHGDASFTRATFQSTAWFMRATFQDDAWFRGATFQGDAMFDKATFRGEAGFEGIFGDRAGFHWATFERIASFSGTSFRGAALFYGATFQSNGLFDHAGFRGDAQFDETIFRGDGRFEHATFHGDAGFNQATFQASARFLYATFTSTVRFDNVTLKRSPVFLDALVLHLDNLDGKRVWPDGWMVHPDPTDPTRGTVVEG
jgi:uncharacterized protein YjbI with pentapeptide repeats